VRSESLFTNSSLERLYLSNCGLPAEGMNMLNKYFSSGDGRIASTLTELVLDKNMIGVEGSKIVGEFLPTLKNLEYFSYNGCRPTEVGTKYVCDGLFNLTSGSSSSPLRRIEMEDCTFGDGEEESDAILPFSAALTKCSQLRHLNITDGGLEVGGIERLTSALTNARVRLSHLYLGKSFLLIFCRFLSVF
jgi:Ran GTPase-activating protein (RanGAP) involved in mRNA processing and transport